MTEPVTNGEAALTPEELAALNELRSNIVSPTALAAARARDEGERKQREAEQRARQREIALAGFVSVKREEITICPMCAAVVADSKRHLDWHESIGRIASQAAHADLYNRAYGA